MSEQTAKKLNINVLTVPQAFFGKARDKKYGSENFVTKDGKRISSAEIFALSLFHTEEVMFGSLNLTPYSAFTDALNYSRPTVCKNLKKLVDKALINRLRQSKFEIVPKFSDKKTVTVYQFLLEEEFDLGGLVRRLTKNEALYLSLLIAFYLNPDNKGKYFVGGVRRAASALNVSESTVSYIIDRLIKTKAIFRKSMTKDSAGNVIISNGKGTSSKEQTVYEVNEKILNRCRAIEKERAELRAVKKLFGQGGKKKETSVPPSDEKAGKRSERFTLAQPKEVSEKFARVFAELEGDETINRIRQRYNDLNARFIEALKARKPTDELEADIETEADRFREYLLRFGLSPGDIPENLSYYIKN